MKLKPALVTVSFLTSLGCDHESLVKEVDSCGGTELVRLEIERSKKKPNTASANFISTKNICIEVISGKGTKKTSPSAARVHISGVGEVLGPSDFKNKSWKKSYAATASDGGNHELSIELMSGPESYLEVAVYENGLDYNTVPEGATPVEIHPGSGGRLDLANTSLRWGKGAVPMPTLIWCEENTDGPEVLLDCGPSMNFNEPLYVDFAISDSMIEEALMTEDEAPTVVWDGEPRPTVTNVTQQTAHSSVTHFSSGTLELFKYVTEANFGEVTEWDEMLANTYPHQRLDFPLKMMYGTVAPNAYDKFIVPKVPGTALEINLSTKSGDADLFSNWTSLDDTHRYSSYRSSHKDGKKIDAVWVPVNKAGLYYVAIQGFYGISETSEYYLSVSMKDRIQDPDEAGWTLVIDAGHGVPGDDENAIAERGLNEDLVIATLQSLDLGGLPVEIVTYDGEIMTWASEDEGVTPDELRERETDPDYGGAGYRGLLIRKWINHTGRDYLRTAVVQIHNDSYGAFDLFGSEASILGYYNGYDPAQEQWYNALKDAMNTSMNQSWLGQLSEDGPRQGFVRGAAGYTMACGQLTSEADCDATSSRPVLYGPGVRAVSLLEVAHYTPNGNLWYDDNIGLVNAPQFEDDNDFIAQTGQALAQAFTHYVSLRTDPQSGI